MKGFVATRTKLTAGTAVAALLLLALFSIAAAPAYAHECPAPGPSPSNPNITCVFQGKMTGGGALAVSFNLTHGFEVYCNSTQGHDNIEVNWQMNGVEHHFHLQQISASHCEYNHALGSPNPPPANFNTWVGSGTGKLDGQSGAFIYAIFTDQGQPAHGADWSTIVIYAPNGALMLNVNAPLAGGAQQAHNGH